MIELTGIGRSFQVGTEAVHALQAVDLGLDRGRRQPGPGQGAFDRRERQPQLLAALARQGQADESAAVGRHEVDRIGRDAIGGHEQIALVLAVFVVDEDEHAPVARILPHIPGDVGR